MGVHRSSSSSRQEHSLGREVPVPSRKRTIDSPHGSLVSGVYDVSGRESLGSHSARQPDSARADRPPDIDQAESSFIQVQTLTQQTFPDMIPAFLPPVKTYSSLSEAQLDTPSERKPVPLLPWCDGVLDTERGLQESTRPPGCPPLKFPRVLPPPTAPMRFYRILNLPRAAEWVPVNDALSSFTPDATKKITPSFTSSEEDLRQVEVSHRRSVMVQSTIDWHLATCARVVTGLIKEMAERPRNPAEELEAIRRLLLSASRGVGQLTRESSTALANTVLHRRDAYIKALPNTVPDSVKLDLRLDDLFSPQLFSDATLTAALEKSRLDATHASHLKMGQLASKLTSAPKANQGASGSSEAKKKEPVYSKDIPKGGARRGGDNRRSANRSRGGRSRGSTRSPRGRGRGDRSSRSDRS